MISSIDPILQQLIQWGNQNPQVRAMLMTSTRAITNAASDQFSDYDIILALTDIMPYHESRDWLEAFGPVLVMFADPIIPFMGNDTSGNVVQFENDLKIDFTLWPVEVLQQVANQPELEPELDAGYQVLLDKDHLTDNLKPPTFRAYIPTPPDEKEYRRIVEVFFLDVLYVAKYIWRGDLMAARFVLVCDLIYEHLQPMLEWHLETDHGWAVKTGPHGRGFKKWLRPDLWEGVESIYTGPSYEESWQGLDRVITLMRKASQEVGDRMGYAYPFDLDRRAMSYLNKIRNLGRGA